MAYEGIVIAMFVAVLSVTLSALGSFVGMGMARQAYERAVAGSERQKKFGKVLILQLLPCTQSIYGFLAMLLIMFKVGLPTTLKDVSPTAGLAILFACLPIMICNVPSSIWQGKLVAPCGEFLVKRPEKSGKIIIFPLIVEIYPVLSLLATILLLKGIPV
ncbi:MAG: permease [Candidatus Thermoplasmatota archaeon]|nr:permease [Candidatus Thermoplasmatota archaeon]